MGDSNKVASTVLKCLDGLNIGTPHSITQVMDMLDNDLTVPFIARYRRNVTNGMEAESIRKIQQTYENIKQVKLKAESIIKKLANSSIPDEVICNLRNAKSFEEVEELYAPYKSGGKGTLAERAEKVGLKDVAMLILSDSSKNQNIFSYQNSNSEGLKSLKEVEQGIQHIIADVVSKHPKVKQKIKESIGLQDIFIISKASAKVKDLDPKQKFLNYYDFKSPLNKVQSHAFLAINRGEALKALKVKYELANQICNWILQWIKDFFIPKNTTDANKKILINSIEDSFNRLIKKSFLRKKRVYVKKKSELDAVEVFHTNLKHLLLVAPVKNKPVLAIDPGFTNGCKVAVIDKNGNLLDTSVIFPFKKEYVYGAEDTLKTLVEKHKIEIMALGNGTACRELEEFISNLIKRNIFSPNNVSYSIVDECGASIYSVTKEAKAEFGKLDPNLISAVSIGRRLQDPLLELHKIEAKHIGVGMYQHDLDSNLLNGAVNGVIEECVSFVGVDLNACSAKFLNHVSGISMKQAESIVKHREKHGPFVNRKQILSIKGIGEKTFKNCAGFIRIIPKENSPIDIKTEEVVETSDIVKGGKRKRIDDTKSASSKRKKLKSDEEFKYEPLDQTWIHPESYNTTYNFLEQMNCDASMIGSIDMKKVIDQRITCESDLQNMAGKLGTNIDTLNMIILGLKQPPNYDIRQEFEKPAFKVGVTKIDQLTVNEHVCGIVRNVTSFGAFVDIGVNVNGLLHKSKIPPQIVLGPGDRIDCVIENVEVPRKRIGLKFLNKVSPEVKLL